MCEMCRKMSQGVTVLSTFWPKAVLTFVPTMQVVLIGKSTLSNAADVWDSKGCHLCGFSPEPTSQPEVGGQADPQSTWKGCAKAVNLLPSGLLSASSGLPGSKPRAARSVFNPAGLGESVCYVSNDDRSTQGTLLSSYKNSLLFFARGPLAPTLVARE